MGYAINYGQNLGPSALETGMDTMQGLQSLRVNQMKVDAHKADQTKQASQQKAAQEFATALQGNDSQLVGKLSAEHPELRKQFSEQVEFQDSLTARPRVALAKEILSGRVGAREAYEQRVMEIEGNGGQAEQLRKTLQEADDNQLMNMAEKDLAMLDNDAWQNYASTRRGEKSNIGAVSPKDFTVDSMSAYEDSGNISDLVRYRPKTVKIAGIDHEFNEQSQKWEPLVDLNSQEITDQTKALAAIKAEEKSQLDFGVAKTKWKTGRPKFKSKIASAKSSQKIMDATANAIKKSLNGWTTSYGASLSGLPSSAARTLKGQINTLKAHSAFSTLIDLKSSGGTLGAISSSELVLLESKLGALDQKGDTAEMIRVLDQILEFNRDSIGRLETEYGATNKMYSGAYENRNDAKKQSKPSGYDERRRKLLGG